MQLAVIMMSNEKTQSAIKMDEPFFNAAEFAQHISGSLATSVSVAGLKYGLKLWRIFNH